MYNNKMHIRKRDKVNTVNNSPVYISITSFSVDKNKWKFEMRVSSRTIFSLKGIILKRRNDENSEINILYNSSMDRHGNTNVKFEVAPDSLEIDNHYWDFYLDIQQSGRAVRKRIKNPGYFVIKKLNKKNYSGHHEKEDIIYPYITVKKGLSICKRRATEYDSNKYYRREKIGVILYYLFKWYWDKKQIWITYEKFSMTAQDNSYYFFRYCKENKLKKNIYYIIKKGSQDSLNLQDFKGNVIDFMSVKHIIFLYASKFIISSESRAHAYIWKENRGLIRRKILDKKHVFLQHGVLGLKKVDNLFKKGNTNDTDLFFVSSDREKEILKTNFGYTEDEIEVSGLSRWDYLENTKREKNSILVMPTWRDWLDGVPEEDFIKTDFYHNYQELINSPMITDLLSKYNIKLYFCMHPRLHSYINCFNSNSSKISFMKFGDVRINDLIMKSSLLITDYSSVAWDMYYLKKPIVFYHADFNNHRLPGSYLNFPDELFGDICFNINCLSKKLEDYIKSNFEEKKVYQNKREGYFNYVDKKNSLRIYNGIVKHQHRLINDSLMVIIKNSDLVKAIRSNIYRWKNSIRK